MRSLIVKIGIWNNYIQLVTKRLPRGNKMKDELAAAYERIEHLHKQIEYLNKLIKELTK